MNDPSLAPLIEFFGPNAGYAYEKLVQYPSGAGFAGCKLAQNLRGHGGPSARAGTRSGGIRPQDGGL